MSARFADMTVDDWRWIRGVNLDGVVHGCHAFGPAMLERGTRPRREPVVRPRLHAAGHRAGLRHHQGRGARAVAVPAGRLGGVSGVGVSAVCPGVINTPILDGTRFLGDAGRDRGAHARGVPPGPPARARRPRRDRRHPRATGPWSPSGWEAKLGWWAHRLLPVAGPAARGAPRPVTAATRRPAARCRCARRRPHAARRRRAVVVTTDDGATPGRHRRRARGRRAPGRRRSSCPTAGPARRAVWVPRRPPARSPPATASSSTTSGATGRRPPAVTPSRSAGSATTSPPCSIALDLRDVVLAGHSMGGMTVMAFACRHPDVRRDRVRADSPSSPPPPTVSPPGAATGSGASSCGVISSTG